MLKRAAPVYIKRVIAIYVNIAKFNPAKKTKSFFFLVSAKNINKKAETKNKKPGKTEKLIYLLTNTSPGGLPNGKIVRPTILILYKDVGNKKSKTKGTVMNTNE